MPPITITNTENCQDTTTIVTTDAETNTTTTQTLTDSQTNTTTKTCPDQPRRCPCGNLNLRRLVEQTRCWTFKSSNIGAATANSVIIFAMQILQEILITECTSNQADINRVFLVAAAIAELGEVVKVYNPPPFNS